VTALLDPLALTRGPQWANRLALAPLTNLQSHPDGTLSEDERRWLRMRAEGGFGLVMTCAAHVQAVGQGFPGQLGVFGDQHLPGLTALADDLRAAGSVSSVQLHHAGIRSPHDLVGQPVGASDDDETGSRGLSTAEVEQLVADFVAAAVRVERAGFDGVEVHGAHGYVVAQFLSAETNRRDDRYGGDLEGRSRLLREVLDGIRASCAPGFQVGLRLSPERFGMRLAEARDLSAELMGSGLLDYLDLSLWDVAKEPVEEEHQGQSLLSHFAGLERHGVRVGVAGKVMTAQGAQAVLDAGVDFVLLGRAAILHHDWPQQVARDPAFRSATLPVTAEHLLAQGLGPVFVDYMRGWRGFVEEPSA
jgi:2,4-dienoyl-CoA reductase-like NADH-dependent reductase (Old Yellow Enzyme family)